MIDDHVNGAGQDHECDCCGAGKFFWFGFIIFLTLNLMCFYGVMGVYITPDLIVGTVLSAFFYGFWCATDAALQSGRTQSGSCRPVRVAQLLCAVLSSAPMSACAANMTRWCRVEWQGTCAQNQSKQFACRPQLLGRAGTCSRASSLRSRGWCPGGSGTTSAPRAALLSKATMFDIACYSLKCRCGDHMLCASV